jgi:hypothetical protein
MEFIWLFPRALLDRPDMGRHHDLKCRKLARQNHKPRAQVLKTGSCRDSRILKNRNTTGFTMEPIQINGDRDHVAGHFEVRNPFQQHSFCELGKAWAPANLLMLVPLLGLKSLKEDLPACGAGTSDRRVLGPKEYEPDDAQDQNRKAGGNSQ